MATDEEKGKAIRLARTIASDISLYNEKKIVSGIENDDLFEKLAGEIEEGRAHYRSKVSKEIYETFNYFDLALVDIVVKPRGQVRSKIW